VSADDVVALPPAFGGQRLDWRDLPGAVRRRISALAGAQVTAEITATEGFSPGFVAVLELADGQAIFVKAVSGEISPPAVAQARREIVVAAALPAQVPAPRLLWSDDDGEWVLLGFEPVQGRSPQMPWDPDDLDRVLAALAGLAEAEPLAGHALPRTDDLLAEEFTGWRHVLRTPAAREALAAGAGPTVAWALEDLDRIVTWEQDALDVCAGDGLVHGDLRADNVLLDDEGERVWLIDWPNASVGAPWLDLAFMLPSVALQGGGDPAALFAAQPVSDGVTDDDLRAVLAGLSGRLLAGSLLPAPRGVPNLRPFQAAQGEAALRWLHTLA
jgi:aminoglycoside phosphotransferase (APT) family kinase protein